MIIEDKGHASIDDPIRMNPVDDLGGAGRGSRGGEREGTEMGKGSTDTKNLRGKSYLQYQG